MEEMRDTELCIDLELRIDLVDLMAEPGTDMDRWSGFWGMGVPKNHGEYCGIIRWSKSFRQWSTKYTGKKMKMLPWLSSTAQAVMSFASQMDNCWVFLLPLRRGLTLPLICKKMLRNYESTHRASLRGHGSQGWRSRTLQAHQALQTFVWLQLTRVLRCLLCSRSWGEAVCGSGPQHTTVTHSTPRQSEIEGECFHKIPTICNTNRARFWIQWLVLDGVSSV